MTELLPTPPRLPSPGEVIERYQIVGRIAQGGMAEVFLARRRGPGGFEKRVAMKVMHAHFAGEPNFVSMFLDEARIASAIDHPNVVRVLDVGLHEGLPWLVMELLHGEPLTTVLMDTEAMPDQRLRIGILLATAEGLHAAHEARGPEGQRLDVVHRDVSPHNVHVGYDGHVKVVDFGIAAAEGRLTRTATGEVKGKFGYLAPEQIKYPGLRVDRRVDLWALGVVAWEMFAKQRLFGVGDAANKLYQILNAPIASVREIAPEVPESVAKIVDACLSRDPDQRPDTAAAIATVLREAIAEDHARLRDDLAAHMERSFGERRRKSEALLDLFQVTEDGPAPPASEDVSGEITIPDAHRGAASYRARARGSAPRSRGRWLLLGLVPLVAVGVALAVAFGPARTDDGSNASEAVASEPTPPRREVESERSNDREPPHTDTAGSTPSAVDTIRVSIGPRVRQVRVDGITRDDRPVRLEIPRGGSVLVELLGARGRTVRRRLRATDDGARLDMPRPRPAAGEDDDTLMESPYR